MHVGRIVVPQIRSTAHTSKSTRLKLALACSAALAAALAPMLRAATVTETWTGGTTGNWSNSANWTPSNVPNNGGGNDYNVQIDNGNPQASAVTMDLGSATIDNLTIDSDDSLTQANNTAFSFVGDGTNATITNNGTFTIASAGNFTDLFISAPTVTLTGTGTLNLQNFDRIRSGGGTPTLVNQSTIAGFNNGVGSGTTLGNNDININNQGTINASSNGNALTVDPASAAGLTNSGTLEATNGGSLQLTGNGGGGFTNTATGVITAIGANSQVNLVSNASISGGTLTTSNGGTIHVVAGHFASISSLTNAGTFDVDNNGNLIMAGTIHNTGTINVNSANNFTDVFVDAGGVTLTGGGTVNLQNFARVRSNSGTPTLTNVDNTIQGFNNGPGGATLGNNDINIVNQATINANSSGNTLTIDPASAAGLTNTATMEATNGGILRLTGNGGGGFTNTGGTIQAVGAGSQVQLVSDASITGGTVTSSSGGSVHILASNRGFLTSLTNSGTTVLDNNSILVMGGTINNTGAIQFNSGGNFTDLQVNGDTSLTGGGTVNLNLAQSAAAAPRVRSFSGTPRLTNVDNTIEGSTPNSGSLGNNEIAITNQSVINANISGQVLLVDPANIANAFINTGNMEATNGGILQLTGSGGGGFTNTGGTIQAIGTGSLVQLINGVSITGGTVTSSNGGSVHILSSHTASFTGLTNAGTTVIDNGAALVLAGTINNTGAIQFNSGGNFTDLQVNGDTSLTGGGTVSLNLAQGTAAAPRVRSFTGTPRLTNVDNTIEGSTPNTGTLGNNDIAITNQSVINANIAGQPLVIDPANVTDGVINTGNMEATNGGILQLTGNGGGGFNNANGTIQAIGTGSLVQLINNASISGGTVTSSSGGSVHIPGGHTAFFTSLTNSGTTVLDNNSTLVIGGTIKNTGAIQINSTGNFTDLQINGDTSLTGGGTVNLNLAGGGNAAPRVRSFSGTPRLTNVDNTIEGSTPNTGTFGNNDIAITNQGTISGNIKGQPLVIDPANAANAFLNDTTGIVQAGDGTNPGQITLSGNGGGAFTNNGTFQALDGSTFTHDGSASLTNSPGTGTLTGGIYKSIANGNGSTLDIPGGNITTNAADVTLSGVGSTFPEINTIAVNQGQFRILNNQNFSAMGSFDNTSTALLQLGGGTFDTPSGTLSNEGLIQGFGTVNPRPTNTGTIEATGGTLALKNGTASHGTVQIDAGASLDLSGSSQNSTTDLLTHNGTNLNLGSHNVVVNSDYTNANFGVGNTFNPHAHVSGTGQIQAAGDVNQAIGGDATGGTTTIPTLDLGNIHTNGSVTKNYTIENTGTSGPVLRGAIQTSVNGGNITDSRLTGTGVTAANYGPLALGASTSNLPVTFSGNGTAGALTGQVVHVESNFDNVRQQNIQLTGAAYRLANPQVSPLTVSFPTVHKGETPSQIITVANNIPADGFSENLIAAIGSPTGDATTNSGMATIAPSATDMTHFAVGINTSSTGSKSGTATVSLTSDGTGIDGLGQTPLSSALIQINGKVNNFADAKFTLVNGSGTLTELTPTHYTLNLGSTTQGQGSLSDLLGVTNDAPAPADSLAGNFTESAPAFTFAQDTPFSGVAAGSSHNGPQVTLSDANSGSFSGMVFLNPSGQNDSGFNGALPQIEVDLSGTVNPATVPEPAAASLLAMAGAMLLRRRAR